MLNLQPRSVAVAKVLDARSEAFVLLFAYPLDAPADPVIRPTAAMTEQEISAALVRLGLAHWQIRDQIARARANPAV
jgi:hypothetical protein